MHQTNSIKHVTDVFKTVGLPPYTYIKPSYYGEIRVDIEQPGRHLLIEGPSGIGKTCVIYKVIEELGWSANREYTYLACRDPNALRRLESFLHESPKVSDDGVRLVIVDDFHLLSKSHRSEVGSLLKRVSDHVFEGDEYKKFALIGIPAGGQSLLEEAQDLGPRMGVYRLKSANRDEINRLIDQGELALNILFQNRETLLEETSGNFWLTQHICSKICSSNSIYKTSDDVAIVSFDILDIRRRIMDELSTRFDPHAETFCKGKKWRPGGNKPYLEVFIALTKTTDLVVSFDKILSLVDEQRRPGIKAIRSRIPEVIHNPTKKIDLRKHIHFESDAGGFSIEDPLFRYYLNHIEIQTILTRLGVSVSGPGSSVGAFSYDVGFSFAGESRIIAEAVNGLLKEQDVITFYDYDQQAVLLGEELETHFDKIYSASCQYYLVFVDAKYRDKVWTKFERDIMVASGRKSHIIPILLERGISLVGVPSTIGHIDLSEVWSSIKKSSMRLGDDELMI